MSKFLTATLKKFRAPTRRHAQWIAAAEEQYGESKKSLTDAFSQPDAYPHLRSHPMLPLVELESKESEYLEVAAQVLRTAFWLIWLLGLWSAITTAMTILRQS